MIKSANSTASPINEYTYETEDDILLITSSTDRQVLSDYARRLAETAKETSRSCDAWRLVDFLHDFPNALY